MNKKEAVLGFVMIMLAVFSAYSQQQSNDIVFEVLNTQELAVQENPEVDKNVSVYEEHGDAKELSARKKSDYISKLTACVLRIIGLILLVIIAILGIVGIIALIAVILKRYHIDTDISVSLDGKEYKKDFSAVSPIQGVVYVKCKISARAIWFLSRFCTAKIKFGIDIPGWKLRVCEYTGNDDITDSLEEGYVTEKTKLQVLPTGKSGKVRLVLRCKPVKEKSDFVFKLRRDSLCAKKCFRVVTIEARQ